MENDVDNSIAVVDKIFADENTEDSAGKFIKRGVVIITFGVRYAKLTLGFIMFLGFGSFFEGEKFTLQSSLERVGVKSKQLC